MKKIFLLFLSLLLSTSLVQSMEKKKKKDSLDEKEFPSLPSKQPVAQNPSNNNNPTIQENKPTKPQITKNNVEHDDKDLMGDNSFNHKIFDMNEQQIIEHNSFNLVSSETVVVKQKDYTMIQKTYNNTYHTARSLACSWFDGDKVTPEWRDRFLRDVALGITKENDVMRDNKGQHKNKSCMHLVKEVQDTKIKRHDLILDMLKFLKKNEDQVDHLAKFIKVSDKGYSFDSASCLNDTFQTLQNEKNHDLLLLALVTQEVQKRIIDKQTACNYIYNITKNNTNVIGSLSEDDYNNATTIFNQSQKLMGEIEQKLEKDNKK